MKIYRVECNFGCKYFKCKDEAFNYFQKCKNKYCNVSVWLMTLSKSKLCNKFKATQRMIDYSFTHFPEF